MNSEQVAADLAKHEAVCAERWKTAFNKFDDMEENIKRIEMILITCAGGIIVGGATVILTILSLHG
jgi:hypothetical protein